MNAAFSYLGEIGTKNESDMFFKKLRQGYSEVSLIVFSLLWTLLGEKREEKGGRRREEEEGGSCSVGRSVG